MEVRLLQHDLIHTLDKMFTIVLLYAHPYIHSNTMNTLADQCCELFKTAVESKLDRGKRFNLPCTTSWINVCL